MQYLLVMAPTNHHLQPPGGEVVKTYALLRYPQCVSRYTSLIKTYYIRNHDINDCVTITHHVCKLSTQIIYYIFLENLHGLHFLLGNSQYLLGTAPTSKVTIAFLRSDECLGSKIWKKKTIGLQCALMYLMCIPKYHISMGA